MQGKCTKKMHQLQLLDPSKIFMLWRCHGTYFVVLLLLRNEGRKRRFRSSLGASIAHRSVVRTSKRLPCTARMGDETLFSILPKPNSRQHFKRLRNGALAFATGSACVLSRTRPRDFDRG